MQLLNRVNLKFVILNLSGLVFLLLLGFVQTTHGRTHSVKGFSELSVKGEYSLTLTGKGGLAPVSALGVINFDGFGNFSGTLIRNMPGSSNGERTIAEDEVIGIYTIDENGTGTLTWGPGIEGIILITKAGMRRGMKRALEISYMRNDLTEGENNLATGVFKKRPNRKSFTSASLDGTYAFTGFGFGGFTPYGAFGIVKFDADTEIVEGDFSVNLPGDGFGGRIVLDLFSAGPFTVRENGLGRTLSDTTGLQSGFLITEAKLVKGIKVAQELVFIPDTLDPFTNSMIVATMSRLPDRREKLIPRADIAPR